MKKIKTSCDRCGKDLNDGNAGYLRKELDIKSPEDSNGDERSYDLCYECTVDLVNWIN